MSDDIRTLLVDLLESNSFRQIFPFAVLFFVPLLVLLVVTAPRPSSVFYSIAMVLESLGISLPWLWSSNGSGRHSSHGSGSGRHHHEKKKSKKPTGRSSKTERISSNDAGGTGSETKAIEDGYFPGLVNISGTYCFMNSTIQALASLTYLQPYIDSIHTKAEALDVPTPVIDALQDLFHRLNTPHSSPSSIRPVDLIAVLSSQSGGRSNSLFNSREHQDAQELFQLVSECLKNEAASVDKEGARDRGLGGLMDIEGNRETEKSVFDGLTANRRSCVVCGYTEAVMHFAFDNWQLAVPRMAASCCLEDCLDDYTRLEVLKDCICRKCSMNATYRRLQYEIKTLSETITADTKPSSSKKRRLRDVKKMEARVKAALDEGRIEEDLKDVRMEKVVSGMSTKQAMIARPPPVLALHINRSVHSSHYTSKNNIRVLFPEVLDLTPFTTSGNLSTVPTDSLSTPSPLPPRSTTPTPATFANITARTIYRLSAVVCHYGQHSFGHYVCFRRKPRGAWKPPRLIIDSPQQPETTVTSVTASSSSTTTPSRSETPQQNDIADPDAQAFSEYIWEDADPACGPGSGRGWLRISDESASECGIESVLREGSGAFMLYYERAVISSSSASSSKALPIPVAATSTTGAAPTFPYASPYPLVRNGSSYGYGKGTCSPLSSEETLKPELMMTMMMNGNGSVGSLVSVRSRFDTDSETESLGRVMSSSPPTMGPRIVRSVAAGRGRSLSAAPPAVAVKRAKSSEPDAPVASSSTSSSISKPISIPMPNGHSHRPTALDDDRLDMVESLSSSAPALLPSKMSLSVSPASSILSNSSSISSSTSSSSSSSGSSHQRQPHNHKPNPPRIHSPQPQSHHPPPSPMVGLRA